MSKITNVAQIQADGTPTSWGILEYLGIDLLHPYTEVFSAEVRVGFDSSLIDLLSEVWTDNPVEITMKTYRQKQGGGGLIYGVVVIQFTISDIALRSSEDYLHSKAATLGRKLDRFYDI